MLKHVIDMNANMISVNISTGRADVAYLVYFIIYPEIAHTQNEPTIFPA